MKKLVFLFVLFGIVQIGFGQTTFTYTPDTLQKSIVVLEKRVFEIENNLYKSQQQLKSGILVATLGYTVTIIGGQLLGTRPQLGETLLYVGGGIGIAGTVVLVRGFNKISLGPPKRFH